MKKILVLFAFIGLAFCANAQFGRAYTIPLAAGDTAVNTGTAQKVITLTGDYKGVAITAIDTKISGTDAGTVAIWGSPDGVNYDIIGTATTFTDLATQSKTFYVAAPTPVYIKVLRTGSGTMSSVLTVKYVIRK